MLDNAPRAAPAAAHAPGFCGELDQESWTALSISPVIQFTAGKCAYAQNTKRQPRTCSRRRTHNCSALVPTAHNKDRYAVRLRVRKHLTTDRPAESTVTGTLPTQTLKSGLARTVGQELKSMRTGTETVQNTGRRSCSTICKISI